jgi:glycosyltransferase involved in cell wall biosynthesis
MQGVRDQTFTDYEVIALDDGSTDGTREWLAEQPDITTVLNETNLGTYGTLNRGLELATGEFIAVLNDDDVWKPNKLEAQIQLLERNPNVALVHTDGDFIDGEGRAFIGEPLGFQFPKFETGNILLSLVYANKIIASAALFRKSVVEKIGKFNEAYFGSGDWEMWFRIAELYDVGCVDARLTQYRVHGANASHKLERIWQDDQLLRTWMLTRLPKFKGDFESGAYRNAIAHCHAALGTVQMLNGQSGKSRVSYLRSIRILPWRFKSYLRFFATFFGRSAFRRLL